MLPQAILDSRRLVAHHSSTVQSSLHALILAVLPSVDALRSSTAKDAISLFQVSWTSGVWLPRLHLASLVAGLGLRQQRPAHLPRSFRDRSQLALLLQPTGQWSHPAHVRSITATDCQDCMAHTSCITLCTVFCPLIGSRAGPGPSCSDALGQHCDGTWCTQLPLSPGLVLAQEMIQSPALVKPLDQEVEHIVPVVLKKAGEMSQAGRETFLAAEASALLSSMADCLSVARVNPKPWTEWSLATWRPKAPGIAFCWEPLLLVSPAWMGLLAASNTTCCCGLQQSKLAPSCPPPPKALEGVRHGILQHVPCCGGGAECPRGCRLRPQ